MKTLAICPTYGRLPYLGRMLSGFLHQDYDDKHLVVINDDANITIYCDYQNVTCINLNKKIHLDDKRNIGVSFGNYDLIFPLDDDDVFLPSLISNHVLKYMSHKDINLYKNQISYVVYGDDFIVSGSPQNACSYKKSAWYSVGGYSHYLDNYSGDMVFYDKMPNKIVESNDKELDFVYNFGGVNYHLTCAKEERIVEEARRQVRSLSMNNKFYIVPDDEEYEKFLTLDKLYKKKKESIKIRHVVDAKIDISHVQYD